MKIAIWLLVVSIVLALLLIGAGQAGLLTGKVVGKLGVTDGRLAPPLTTPNSVSSQANLYPGHPQLAYARIEPLKFTGDGMAAMARLASQLGQTAGATIITARPDYIYVQYQTPWLKFTDDVEFWLDPAAGVIALRSASRLGKSDLGTNRKRIEAIRAEFNS